MAGVIDHGPVGLLGCVGEGAQRVDQRLVRGIVYRRHGSFCVVRDKKVLARISREAKTYMLKNTSVGLMSHHFSEILNDANFDIFYHAPVLVVISTVADIPWTTEDAALAAENLMLAARAAGLTLRNYTIKNIWCRDPRSIRYRVDQNLPLTTGRPARAPYYEDAAENPNRRSVCLTTKRL
jgi:hypothetical protein